VTSARGSARVRSAFLPVTDVAAAARWYHQVVGLPLRQVDEWAAQLGDESGTALTLMGPASGIPVAPGLPFAAVSILLDQLDATRDAWIAEGHAPSAVEGDPDVCRFFTMKDPDGNVLLFVDR